MMALEERTNLICPSCNSSRRFFNVVELTFSMSGGIYDQPSGMKCAECFADIDKRALTQNAILTKKKLELIATQKEIEEEQLQVAQVSPKNASPQGNQVQSHHHKKGQEDQVSHSPE